MTIDEWRMTDAAYKTCCSAIDKFIAEFQKSRQLNSKKKKKERKVFEVLSSLSLNKICFISYLTPSDN